MSYVPTKGPSKDIVESSSGMGFNAYNFILIYLFSNCYNAQPLTILCVNYTEKKLHGRKMWKY